MFTPGGQLAAQPVLPFGQVAGEVAAEADDAPVFPVVNAVEGLAVGQVHLGHE